MIGKVIGKYRVESKLGEGGMGIVYKAWDTVLERPVALKMMHPALAQDEKLLHRFRSEAKALAQLEDPHIVAVYDLLESEGGLYIAMQFVEGATLAEKIRCGGALRHLEAVEILKQLLLSLKHAHGAGVIHRDIKPGNIIITPSGFVKVTDFGLAKIQHATLRTLSKITGGTLRYMPPEQLRNLADVDQRSDIYSAGMTFYEMLAGRLPFDQVEDLYLLSKLIVKGKHPPPEKYNPAAPKELSKIAMKAIAKEQQKRFQTADEMLEAVADFEKKAIAVANAGSGEKQKARRRCHVVAAFLRADHWRGGIVAASPIRTSCGCREWRIFRRVVDFHNAGRRGNFYEWRLGWNHSTYDGFA
jgi:serine/threonine protein kinase